MNIVNFKNLKVPNASSIFTPFKKLFECFLFTIACLFSAVLLYPLIIPSCLFFFIYRQLVKILVKARYPRCGPMLTGINALAAEQEPYTRPLVLLSPYITFVSKLDRANIVKVINDQIIKPNMYPELKQKIVLKCGYYFWYPVEDFDVEHHVKYLNPECPEKPVTRQELRRWGVERMGKLPFDSRQSPWDIILVPNLVDETNPAVKSAVYVRANHCLMDGYSICNFISKCAKQPWIAPAAQKYLKPKAGFRVKLKALVQLVVVLLTGPYHTLNTTLFLNDKNSFLSKALFPSSPADEEKYGVKELEPRRIDEERLKKLRKALNVSMSSLLLTMCVEGVTRFMKMECYKKFAQLPKQIILQMSFPLPGHPDALTNHWSVVRFPIQMSMESDPVKRLNIIHRQFEYFKESVIPLATFIFIKLISLLPVKLHPKLEDHFKQTIICTSMPGPVEKVDMFGYEYDSLGLSGSPASGSAFVIACLSYCGKFWMDAGGVGTIFKSQHDLKQVEDLIHGVLTELEDIVANKRF